MMRSLAMNALRAISMSDKRRSSLRAYAVGALFAGVAALSASYALSIATEPHLGGLGAGASVHAKNGDTPDWIVDLQTRNAGQVPVPVDPEEPSFWI
jgi:hypothetical protein